MKSTSQVQTTVSKVKCKGCSTKCFEKQACKPFQGKLRTYSGLRYTADGFDCALPVAMDNHSTCSFRCMYCFSNFLMRDPHRTGGHTVGQWPIRNLRAFLAGEGKDARFMETLVRIGQPGKRAPIQWGALGDPFDNIEAHQGWALQAIPLFEAVDQPVRVSTKGARVLIQKPYLRAFKKPHLWWFAFSIISADDEVLARVDKDAPSTKARIAAMRAVTSMGAEASLRFRPIIPGISDSTKKHPKAWRDLLRMSADAGARAVSMEFAFVPGAMPPHVKAMWREVERICGFPIVDWYRRTTASYGACLRSSRQWKENLTFAIRDEAHRLGMTFAISDPHWKELNDYGCCCGIPPNHPIFGGWARQQATNALVRARDAHKAGKTLLISAKDGIPFWAKDVRIDEMVCVSGARNAYKRHTLTWEDKLRATWNDVKGARGPVHYFSGALMPVRYDEDGDVLYEYKPVPRTMIGKTQPYIHV